MRPSHSRTSKSQLAQYNIFQSQVQSSWDPHYGDINFPDFLVVSRNFDEMYDSRAQGGLDGNGVVAFPDFLVLSANVREKVAAGPVTY